MSTETTYPAVLTIIYLMTDGSHVSRHRHFGTNEPWDQTVIEARDMVRAHEAKYPGCVVTAHLYKWLSHEPSAASHAPALVKIFQPMEWAAAHA